MDKDEQKQQSQQKSSKVMSDTAGSTNIVQSIRNSNLFQQGARYVIIGLSSAAIELVLFFLLQECIGIDVVVSNVVAITLSTIFNFTLSRNWTFKSVSSLPRSIVLYLLLFVWNQLFSSWALVGLMNLGLYSMLAKICTMVVIVCWNFVLYRKVVFR